MSLSGSGVSINELKITYDEEIDLFLSSDLDGMIVEARGAVQKILGYTPEQLVGKQFLDFMHPDDRALTESVFKTTKEVEDTFTPHFENRYLHSDGSIRNILWSGFFFHDRHTVCGYGRDVTGLRMTESAFEQLQKTAKIGSWRYFITTGKSIWSDGVYEIYEVPLGTPVDSIDRMTFYAESDRKKILDHFHECVRTGNPYEVELELFTPQGKKWVRSIGQPIRYNGKIVEVHGVFQDITDTKNQQLEIERQKMTLIENSKLSALGQMAAGIAHEVYNPLTVIQGRALMSLKKGEFSAKDLEAILNNCERIEKIIRGMTAFARKEATDPVEKFKVAPWLEEIHGLCKERFLRERTTLEWKVPEGLQITGQPVPLSQILLNLFNNSVDAMAEIEERKIRLQVALAKENIEFSITNTGPAVSEDVQKKMFEPFFTTKPIGKGTGLGLSIARAIARNHGGDLVYANTGSHPSFILRIPNITR